MHLYDTNVSYQSGWLSEQRGWLKGGQQEITLWKEHGFLPLAWFPNWLWILL